MARRAFARWFVLAGLLGLAGCWPQPGWGPEHQRWNPIEDQLTAANVADLEVDWEAATGLSPTEPIVQAGRVYVGEVVNAGGWVPQVTAFDIDSGDPVWRAQLADPLPVPTIELPGVAVAGPDLLATWRVFFQSQFFAVCDAQVVRLDPATGEVRSTTPGPVWETSVDGQVATLAVGQGRLFASVTGDDSRIVAYAANGI